MNYFFVPVAEDAEAKMTAGQATIYGGLSLAGFVVGAPNSGVALDLAAKVAHESGLGPVCYVRFDRGRFTVEKPVVGETGNALPVYGSVLGTPIPLADASPNDRALVISPNGIFNHGNFFTGSYIDGLVNSKSP